MKEIRLEVFGRVQGVNFRNNIKKFCDANDIHGYTVNREDGSVLVVAQASDERLNELIYWINKSPGLSKVKNTKCEISEIKEKFNDFRILRDDFFKDQGRSLRSLGRGLFG